MDKKTFWNSEKMIGLSAIFISLMTLIVFTYQTRLIREQQHMSVLPYLTISNQETGRPNYKLVLINNGIGPAFIESVSTTNKNEKFELDLPQYLFQYIPGSDSLEDIYHSNISKGLVIPAGRTIPIFEVENNIESAIRLYKILYLENDINIEIIYRSAYGERWKFDSNEDVPIKLD